MDYVGRSKMLALALELTDYSLQLGLFIKTLFGTGNRKQTK
jgi:hypothetical protein